MQEEVVVTSYGIVSPIGFNAQSFETAMFAGQSGVRALGGHLAAENFPVPYAAWIDRESLPPSVIYAKEDQSKLLKSWLMTEAATWEALKNFKAEDQIDAVVFGTADGVSYELVEEVLKNGMPADFDYTKTTCESSLIVIQKILNRLGMHSLPERSLICLNSACASGNQTIGLAFEGIRSGRWTRCLVGGVDARCELSNFLNFHLLGAVTTAAIAPEKASRPFSKDRTGFVRGEGAAVLVLETRKSAMARGATILGQIIGYGCTSDAYRLTDGREDVQSVVEAMQRAITSAGLSSDQIDYINAHGTSTPLNDRLETVAIKKVFGPKAYQIPISSLKSQIGHSTIASSSIEAIAALMMLKRQLIAPTMNCDVPDPECDLDYVPNKSRPAKVTNVLSNSFGFGGQNTCVVFSKGS